MEGGERKRKKLKSEGREGREEEVEGGERRRRRGKNKEGTAEEALEV